MGAEPDWVPQFRKDIESVYYAYIFRGVPVAAEELADEYRLEKMNEYGEWVALSGKLHFTYANAPIPYLIELIEDGEKVRITVRQVSEWREI